MEKAREYLENLISSEEAQQVSELTLSHRSQLDPSFYVYFAIRGVRVDRVNSGSSISCSFKVPYRLLDGNGNLATAAIATLIDVLGATVVYDYDHSLNVSVDMSVSYISAAKLNDELEIIATLLGRQGKYSGSRVLIRNKTTGGVVAEGRHSLFDLAPSKM